MVAAESNEAVAALRCWVEGRRVWVELADQRLVSFPASNYPRLAQALLHLVTISHVMRRQIRPAQKKVSIAAEGVALPAFFHSFIRSSGQLPQGVLHSLMAAHVAIAFIRASSAAFISRSNAALRI